MTASVALAEGRYGDRPGKVFRTMATVLTAIFVLLAAMVMTTTRAEAGIQEETVWLCKPGIDDNPCLDGDLDGTRYLPTGQTEPFQYRPATRPRFDCFYAYPTQSEQPGPNADLSRDPELKAVAVNQAAQFSRICNVYAPVYRQYTLDALDLLDEATPEQIAQIRDVAYGSLKAAFDDFIANHSKGRGFVLIGHSQGSSHLSRLIDETIDPSPALRRQMISAIVPGSNNIYVPRGGVVGGNLENIPACTGGDQLGCVMAWSLYLDKSEAGLPPNASFGRLETGYWVYPEERPDSSTYEVLCVNPANLANEEDPENLGLLTPLASLPAFIGNLDAPNPWTEARGLYRAECLRDEDASWLNMTRVPGVTVPVLDGILPLINSNAGGLHTGDVNLVLGDLIAIATRQGARHTSWRDAVARAGATARRASAEARKATRLSRVLKRTSAACKNRRASKTCRKASRTRAQARKARALAKSLAARSAREADEAEAIYAPLPPCPPFSPQPAGAGAEPRPVPRVC